MILEQNKIELVIRPDEEQDYDVANQEEYPSYGWHYPVQYNKNNPYRQLAPEYSSEVQSISTEKLGIAIAVSIAMTVSSVESSRFFAI